MSRTCAEIIEIGRDLIEAKKNLGHGNFLPWIEAEFGMSERTAQRFMDCAGTFKSASVADLPPTILYALAAPSTPEPVREEFLREAAAAGGATPELIAAAHRAQADALEIEAQAKRRLADEYDAAQSRGEVHRHGGQGRDVPEGNIPPASVTDLGLTRKAVHEARQIRNAEALSPGIVRRTVDAKLAAGEEQSPQLGPRLIADLPASLGVELHKALVLACG